MKRGDANQMTIPPLLRVFAAFAASCFLACSISSQTQPQIQLPSAAHKVGETAGFYVDPMTGNKVYRLSDPSICPGGGSHLYSWSTEFSKQGKMLVVCDQGRVAAPLYLVYDRDFKLLTNDLLSKTGAPPNLRLLQWSHSEEVLFGKVGPKVYRLDLAAQKSRVFAEFRYPGAGTIRDMWVGPKDRIVVDLQPGGGNWRIIAVGVFDPVTGNYWYWNPEGKNVHQITLTQNPAGRVLVSMESGRQFVFSLDFNSHFELPKGHYGFLALHNGRYGIVKPIGDCTGGPYWKWEYGIVDDETGETLLRFGCDVPGQSNWEHIGRSIEIPDTFSMTSHRYPFPPSRSWQSHYEAVLIAKVEYNGDKPSSVAVTPIAYHRSAAAEFAKARKRDCGYWAYPRGTFDHTGTRVLFDSTMSHPDWPSLEVDGKLKTNCKLDVYVAVADKAP